MNQAHIHLLFNHFPIIGSIIAVLVLLAGMILKNQTVRYVAYGLFVFALITTVPAFLTGEGAEEIVESYPGVSHDIIHEHEERAEAALWLMVISGILAGIVFFLEQSANQLASKIRIALLAMALANVLFMARAGNSGGKIRHPELSGTAIVAQPDSSGELNEKEEHD
jgi:uncharacterized membrane protein